VTRLSLIPSRELIKYLTKERRFRYVHTRGSHHIYKDSKHRISIPERKELGMGLLRTILSEAGINEDEFAEYW